MHCGLAFSDHEDEGLDFSDFDEDDEDDEDEDGTDHDDDDDEEDDDDDDDDDGLTIGPDYFGNSFGYDGDDQMSWATILYHGGRFADEDDEGGTPFWDDEAEEDFDRDSDEETDEDDLSDEDDDEETDSFIDSRSETEILAEGEDGETSDISVPYPVRANNYYTQPDSSMSQDNEDSADEEEIMPRRSRLPQRHQRVAVDTDEENGESDGTVRNTTTTEGSSSSSQSQQAPPVTRRRTRNAVYISDDD